MPDRKSEPEQMPLNFDGSCFGDLSSNDVSNVVFLSTGRQRPSPVKLSIAGPLPAEARTENDILIDILKRADRLSW